MLKGLFGPWPNYSEAELEAVSAVLRSGKVNYWTGEECRKFEEEFANFVGTSHAIALANGTLALDLALHGFGIGAVNGGSADDEVIVTPRSFMASASTVVNAGAVPVFADVDLDSQNISPETVAPLINEKTRAIICVHLAGWPCDMDGFKKLVEGKNIRLIEDCAQAHGALYKGRSVGGLGDAAAWSFCQDKIMSTGGEGGMITCNDETVWRKMWAFKDHGKSYEAVYEREHKPGFRWLHESFGTNFRMTEMQAAIGRLQLTRLEEWNAVRRQNADALAEMFSKWAGPDGFLRIPDLKCEGCSGDCAGANACRHARYKFYMFLRPENLPEGWDRDKVIEEIWRQGLPCMQGSCPEIYLERAFDNTGMRPEERLPNAKSLGENSLMFLVHPGVIPVSIDLDVIAKAN